MTCPSSLPTISTICSSFAQSCHCLYSRVILVAIVSLVIHHHCNHVRAEGDRGPISFKHGGCTYSFVINQVDPSKCHQLMKQQQKQQKTEHGIISYQVNQDTAIQPSHDRRTHGTVSNVMSLIRKVHNIENRLASESQLNKKMNQTLAMQRATLKHAEKVLSHHQRKLSLLTRRSTEALKILYRQKTFNKNIEQKLSNVIENVEELSNSKVYPQSDVQEKMIPVEAAPEVTDCNVPTGAPKFLDCTDVYQRGHSRSGVYYITPMYSHCPIPVWCDMDTPGGGWLVIQRRLNGKVMFDQNWETYRNGFGDVTKELWLGNANIFLLTNQKFYELRVEMWDFNDKHVYAVYKNFKIDGERDWYRLHVSNHSGTAPDGLSNHNGMYFSTSDADHDKWSDYNCSKEWQGGWWYNYCWFVILNGPYYNTTKVKYRGISWNDWKREQLKKVEMKIRPLSY